MSSVFNSLEHMVGGVLPQIHEASLTRASKLSLEGQHEQAIRALDCVDVKLLPVGAKLKIAKVYYEAAKPLLWRGEFFRARELLSAARNLGTAQWLVEERLHLLNQGISKQMRDQAQNSANNIERFIIPPEDLVSVEYIDSIFALTVYRWQGDLESGDALSKLIRELKKVPANRVADVLGVLLAHHIHSKDANIIRSDFLIPVPGDPVRTLERGFDNVAQLALALGRLIATPVATDILYKHRSCPDLRNIPRSQRRSVLLGAFGVHSKRIERIRSARILLVDDVVTSGSTLDSCAKVLKEAGASEVMGCAISRSESSA